MYGKVVKSQFGWKPCRIEIKSLELDAEVYRRRVPGVGSLFYLPGLSGITNENATQFTDEMLVHYKNRGYGLRLEPNQPQDNELLETINGGAAAHVTFIFLRKNK